MTDALDALAREVLDFWLGDGVALGWPSVDLGKRWFRGNAALDCDIEQRFGPLVRQAIDGGLTEWEATPLPRLALVILLDQFTRNVFRGRSEAFSGDARAVQLVLTTLQHGEDATLPWIGRVFLYMPLMHAEDLELQQRCLQCFKALWCDVPQALKGHVGSNLRFAKSHLEIIERFGRFPYRNAVLTRVSSAAEIEFLQHGPRFGQ